MKNFIRLSLMVRMVRHVSNGPESKLEIRLAVIDCLWMDAFTRGYVLFKR